jgi:broad specificity phosphatase PhoE
LTERGIAQARDAADQLATLTLQHRLQHILSSPLQRCVQTAAIVAERLQLPIVLVPGLAECVKAARRLDVAKAGTFESTETLLQACAPLVAAPPRLLNWCPTAEAQGSDADVPLTFEDAVMAAIGAYAGKAALLCTHREAFKLLADLCDDQDVTLTRKQLLNCALGHFEADAETGEVRFHTLQLTAREHLAHRDEQREKRRAKKKRSVVNRQARRNARAKREAGDQDGDAGAAAAAADASAGNGEEHVLDLLDASDQARAERAQLQLEQERLQALAEEAEEEEGEEEEGEEGSE